MTIQVTENAAKQIRTQIAKRGHGIGLRVGVKETGCSGFAYTYDYADEVRPGDSLIEAHDAKINAICVRDFDALPPFARQLVEHMRAGAG